MGWKEDLDAARQAAGATPEVQPVNTPAVPSVTSTPPITARGYGQAVGSVLNVPSVLAGKAASAVLDVPGRIAGSGALDPAFGFAEGVTGAPVGGLTPNITIPSVASAAPPAQSRVTPGSGIENPGGAQLARNVPLTPPVPSVAAPQQPSSQDRINADLARAGITPQQVASAPTIAPNATSLPGGPGTYRIGDPNAGENSFIQVDPAGKRHVVVAGDPAQVTAYNKERDAKYEKLVAEDKKAKDEAASQQIRASLIATLNNPNDPGRAAAMHALASLQGNEISRMNAQAALTTAAAHTTTAAASAKELEARAGKIGEETKNIQLEEAKRARVAALQEQIAAETDPKKQKALQTKLLGILGKQERDPKVQVQVVKGVGPDGFTPVETLVKVDADGNATPIFGHGVAQPAPPGMTQVGTSGGKPVYEDAQGKRFVGK